MSLREQIRARSAELVERGRVTLPEAGIEIQVRGLMAGEVRRSGEHKRPDDVQIALSAEDPATSKPIWNANSLDDLEEIAALHPVDYATLVRKSNELSGVDRLKKLFSPPTKNSTSSSSDSESAAEPSAS